MKKIVSFVLLSAFLVSCKKDKVINTPVGFNLDTTNIIGSWKITSDIEFVNINTVPPSATPLSDTSFDVFSDTSYYPSCKTDDLYELNHGGNYIYNDAGQTCSPSGTINNGTWSYNNNTLTLNNDTFQISHFECNKMITTSPTYTLDTLYMGVLIRIQAHYNTTFIKQ